MQKKLIITEQGASTTGKCPYCDVTWTVSPMPNDPCDQRKKLQGIYGAHLKEKKHRDEDVSFLCEVQ